jgi:hypothetical protein
MLTACTKGRALMGGTTAMREAGTVYLPKFSAESPEAYDARLRASWLFNGYRKTVRDMTGRVFDKPVELAEGGAQALSDWEPNVDLAGRDLSTFAAEVFKDGLSGPGISWIMVDAPARDGTVTRAQAQAANLRPYLTHLTIEDVLGWRVEAINNVPTVTMLRIMEKLTERDPRDEFAEVKIDQVRVLDVSDETGGRVRTRLYRKGSAVDAKWEQFGEDSLSDMTEITVAPFYANRTGFWKAEPVLDDLADINIAHWQSQSDQRNILHFARVPLLVRTGWDGESSALALGAATTMDSSSPDAKVMWVEHSGQAIAAGRQDLKDLEFQMETHGLQLLATRAQSATGEALDAAKETSQLAMMADSLRDALERALGWMLVYAGQSGTVSVNVNTDFGVSMMTAQELGVMLQAVQTGNLSRATFIGEMVRRGALRSDVKAEEEIERIETEAPGLTGNPLGLGQQDEGDDAAA